MKKWLVGCLVASVMMSNVCYGESINLDFMDLAFNKVEKMTEARKILAEDILRGAFYDASNLELFKYGYSNYLTDEEKEKLVNNGLTDAVIQENIEKLKTWSQEDRYALLEYGFMEDQKAAKEKIKELNEKNAATELAAGTIDILDEISPLGSPDPTLANRLLARSIAENKGLRLGALLAQENGKSVQYEDIQLHWSKEYMSFLIDAEILSGKTDTKAAPDDLITKAEIVALTMRMFAANAGLSEGFAQCNDVSAEDWYYKEMMVALQLGLISEDEEGYLLPNEEPTRAEIVDYLVKIYQAYGLDYVLNDEKDPAFNDFYQTPDQYKESMKKALGLKIIQGMDGNLLAPNEKITRAQLAVMLNQLYTDIYDAVISEGSM